MGHMTPAESIDYMEGEPMRPFLFAPAARSLTDAVGGGAEGLQLGAAAQEVHGKVLHAVVAHVQQPELRQPQRLAELGQNVPGKRKKRG